MYNLHLSAEQLEFRDTVRDFVAQEIKPIALKPERLEPFEHPLLMEILDKASNLGLRTLALSEENGGAGADSLTSCIVTEELAVGDVDIAAVLAETSTLSHILFHRLMTPAQRNRFLPQFLKDDRYHLAFAGPEPGTDTRLGVNYHCASTPSRIATKAVRAGNGDWVINGIKDCVLNAPVAKLFVVQVATDLDRSDRQDTNLLLVPYDAPGLAVREQNQAKLRCHGAGGELIFGDCRVPAENLLSAEVGSAAALWNRAVERGSPQEQALNLGIGRAAYEAALDYAQLRVQGGRRIIEHQAIGTKLAEIAISLEVARNAIWQAAYASDHPDAVADRSLPDLPLQIIAKVFTSEAVYRAAKDAAEVFGAMGVMRDMPLQKYVHDALVCLHSGDGNSDAKLRIAEALAGYRRP
jgi:alkylation response protein AidB-like acyl-CoA dehydrogenase